LNCRAVNLRKENYDVYIGRTGHGLDGYFGNPSRTGVRCTVCGRGHVSKRDTLNCFRIYFHQRIRDDAEFAARVRQLRGKRLGCFCTPAPCHGNVIAKWVNGLNMTTSQYTAFQYLKSNVKDDALETGLDPCTAIVGPGRSYKTAIIDSVRLALSGRHPVGKDPKDLALLRGVSTRDAGSPLLVSLQGPDGFAEFTVPMNGGRPRRPDSPKFEGKLSALTEAQRDRMLLPVPVGDLMTGGSRGRAALLARFGGTVSLAPPLGLDDNQKTLWARACGDVRAELESKSKGEPVADTEVLAGLESWFNRFKLGKGREKKELESAIERRRSILEQTGSAEVLEEIRMQLAKAERWVEDQSRVNRLEMLKRRREELEGEIEKHRADVTAFETQKAAAAEVVDTEDQERRLIFGEEFLVRLEKAAGIDAPACPCCDREWTQALALARAERVAAAVEARREALMQVAAVQDFSAGEKRLRDRKDWMAKERASLDSGIAELGAVGFTEPWDGLGVEQLRAQVTQLENVDRTQKAIELDAARIGPLQVEWLRAQTLQKEAKKALLKAFESVREVAEKEVNAYMPEAFRAILYLDASSTEWRVMGRDEESHGRGIWCGSEQGALMIALTLAWTAGSPLRVLLLDDPDLGHLAADVVPQGLGVVRDAVCRGDLTQAIIAMSRPAEIPEGWTKIVRG